MNALVDGVEAPLVFYNVENFTTRVRARVSGINSSATDESWLLVAELCERDFDSRSFSAV